MRQVLVWFLCLVCVGSSAACLGGGDGNDSGGLSTGVAPETTLDMLTQADADKICVASADHVRGFVVRNEYREFACRLQAMFAGAEGDPADGSATCVMTYDACVQAFSATVSPANPCTAPACSNVTVADLEQCMDDQASAFGSVDIPSCAEIDFSTLTQQEVSALLPDEPQSCQTLDTECPGAGELIDPNVQGIGF